MYTVEFSRGRRRHNSDTIEAYATTPLPKKTNNNNKKKKGIIEGREE